MSSACRRCAASAVAVALFVCATASLDAAQAPKRDRKAKAPAVALEPGWHVLGPLEAPKGKDAFDHPFGPEIILDLEGGVGKARWQARPKWADGVVHNLPGGDTAVTYLARTITAALPTKLHVYLGSDDGIAVWLNGDRVHARDVFRSASPNQDAVDLALRAGENRLLIKIVNRRGSMGFYFSTSPTPAAEAAGRVGRQAQPAAEPAEPPTGLDALAALRRAVVDLAETFGERYPHGPAYLEAMDALAASALDEPAEIERFQSLRSEALLANPLLDFDRLLLVRREGGPRMGLPQNWQGNCALPRDGYRDEIAVLSPVRPGGEVTTLFRPDPDAFVGDVDLAWDADRLLFSSIGEHNRWHVFEVGIDGSGLRQVTPGDLPDVDFYDACYLPDGGIVFGSTENYQGVPCVGGRNQVANLCRMDADGSNLRRLCFDQDHNWCPTVLHDGRVMYTRWEYSDTPHYFTRILFRMNPDGTGQMALYGSNSYWPNSLFYARPVPGHPTKLVSVISGHHGVARAGELVVFDPARGQHEAAGALQRIPGHGRPVPPILRDRLVNRSWPRFLHPWPLSEKYVLVACQPDRRAPWGLYLVDVFDNMLCLLQDPKCAYLEPVPLRPRPRPAVIPDRVRPDADTATVYLTDVYEGDGLAGVPRGTVKRLRVFAFDYGYRNLANHTYIGIDGPWDVHRILGTVPVEKDGSAAFRVPANTPLAVQPLDSGGRAVQVMRSWFTAMPGENLSCVGCHERLSDASPVRMTLAMRRRPDDIEPWYGPARGFSFKRDVQPVLDTHCVRCHDGSPKGDKKRRPDLRADEGGGFDRAYRALHPYVRRPGPESDYHILPPMEYHASTSELVQMLEAGHHDVQLDAEAWDRLVTWIDLNVPCHGTWSEFRPIPNNGRHRRRQLRARFAGLDVDYEIVPDLPGYAPPERRATRPERRPSAEATALAAPGPEKRTRAPSAPPEERTVELAPDLPLVLVRVPAAGDGGPFWIGKHEVSNAQFAAFDPAHDSRYFNRMGKDQSNRGEPMNRPEQPVVRVSWDRAAAFCRRLSERIGERAALPTEAQWEIACRAGSTARFAWGDDPAAFATLANLADARFAAFQGKHRPTWRPGVKSVQDGHLVTAPVASFEPNAWGLHHMHGNAAEWTRTEGEAGTKVVRGGSFADRPHRATCTFRLAYPAWQRVYNVGFRIVIEE